MINDKDVKQLSMCSVARAMQPIGPRVCFRFCLLLSLVLPCVCSVSKSTPIEINAAGMIDSGISSGVGKKALT